MSTPKTHRSLAILRLPGRINVLITYADGIAKGLTNNPYFPNPSPSVAVVTSAIADLQDAETAAHKRTTGAVATRNEKRTFLVGLLQQVRSYVQSIADANPENGPSIIQSAGLAVKKVAVRHARIFAAHPGTGSGTVKVEAPSAGHRASYEWQYSSDGGKTWLDLGPSLQAKITMTGQTPGAVLELRYRWVLKTGPSDWSAPVSYVVK